MLRSVSPWMYTMNRCLLSSLVAVPWLAAALTCAAQGSVSTLPAVQTIAPTPHPGVRTFPAATQLGVLRIDNPPHAQLNGTPLRTAPGFRLFSPDNKLIFAHSVQGQALRVAYLKEASTQWLQTAWILTPEEQALFSTKR